MKRIVTGGVRGSRLEFRKKMESAALVRRGSGEEETFGPSRVARSGDRATTRLVRRGSGGRGDLRSEQWEETFGPSSGTVGRPCHNEDLRSEQWHGRETVPQRVRSNKWKRRFASICADTQPSWRRARARNPFLSP